MTKQTPEPKKAAPLDHIRQKNQSRDELANLVTVIMLLLTLLVLGWVAYQINHPIEIYLSGLLGR